MNQRNQSTLEAVGAGVLLIVAVGLGVSRMRGALRFGEEGVRSYFYDLSERKLYAVPRDTLPPHDGIGGATGDGVRAVVVAPREGKPTSSTQRIAYLETYSPALKEKLDGVQAARKAGRGSEIKGVSGVDPFVIKNTLVRREREGTWYDMTTPEAKEIIGEWIGWKDEAGKPLAVVTP